jgi:hypothetical protein
MQHHKEPAMSDLPPLPPMALTVTDEPGRGHYYTADQMREYAAAAIAAQLAAPVDQRIAELEAQIAAPAPSEAGLLNTLLASFEAIQAQPKSFWDCSTEIAAIRAQLAAPDQDSVRLDHIEQWRQNGIKRGFRWDQFAFDMDRPIRPQLDALIAAAQGEGA